MELLRRQLLHLVTGVVAFPCAAWAAQSYPTHPVRVIVGLPAGLQPDIVARLVAQGLSERLGQPVIIENKPGAGGNIATELVAKGSSDGYLLLLTIASDSFNAALYAHLSFDYVHDTAPVAMICTTPFVMVVNPSVPAKTVQEFIAYAKANPGKINMASSGVGTAPHLVGELFKMMTGVELVHVPYRGSSIPDLLAGQVQLTFTGLGSAIEYIRTGKLRALAVTTAARVQILPDVPTVGEFVTGYEASGWNGIVAPRNIPAAIVEKLNREINAVVADPKVTAHLNNLGVVPISMAPSDFGKLIADETEKWAKVVKFAGIKPI